MTDPQKLALLRTVALATDVHKDEVIASKTKYETKLLQVLDKILGAPSPLAIDEISSFCGEDKT